MSATITIVSTGLSLTLHTDISSVSTLRLIKSQNGKKAEYMNIPSPRLPLDGVVGLVVTGAVVNSVKTSTMCSQSGYQLQVTGSGANDISLARTFIEHT